MSAAERVKLKVIEGGERPSGKLDDAELSDAELVRAAQGGADWAEEALARRHIDGVMTLVERLLGSSADVEDVVQETFLYAFQGLPKLSAPAAFKGWLFRIAINRVRRTIRRRRLLRTLGLDSSEQFVFLDELAHERIRPEVRSEIAALDQVLRALPSDQRVAWMLRHVEGYSVRDVARLTSLSETTTKRRIAAAQKRVQRAVDVEVLRHG
jgi:RNA polymerase sigma-70 factor (ECF subfamily)